MIEPNADEWFIIQDATADCPMSIVGQLQRGNCTPTQALERIEKYAIASFQVGFEKGTHAMRRT